MPLDPQNALLTIQAGLAIETRIANEDFISLGQEERHARELEKRAYAAMVRREPAQLGKR